MPPVLHPADSLSLSHPRSVIAAVDDLVAGQLTPSTRRAYQHDAHHFLTWVTRQGLSFSGLTPNDMHQYRRYLSDSFAKTTASRKLVVARRLLEEAVSRGLLPSNPAHGLKGYANASAQETVHTALEIPQAHALLAAIDTTTKQGLRDYALVSLLLRTGLRRSEAAALTIGDIQYDQGYFVAVIRHAKGDKRRKVKLPVPVKRALDVYLAATGRTMCDPGAPLFVGFRKGDHPQDAPISGQLIQRVVEMYATKTGVTLTPHGLRATFVTLALEGGAKLHQVQYAVGHTDPRTTERYQKRKTNLDDNATDYVRL